MGGSGWEGREIGGGREVVVGGRRDRDTERDRDGGVLERKRERQTEGEREGVGECMGSGLKCVKQKDLREWPKTVHHLM